MPPKDMSNGEGWSYYIGKDGLCEKLGRIEDVDLDSAPGDFVPVNMLNPIDKMTFTASLNMPQTFQRYVLGFPMPNNWLKMHGLPMRRKRARKEAVIIGALIPKRRSIVSCCGGFSVWMGKKYEELGNAKENRSDA